MHQAPQRDRSKRCISNNSSKTVLFIEGVAALPNRWLAFSCQNGATTLHQRRFHISLKDLSTAKRITFINERLATTRYFSRDLKYLLNLKTMVNEHEPNLTLLRTTNTPCVNCMLLKIQVVFKDDPSTFSHRARTAEPQGRRPDIRGGGRL